MNRTLLSLALLALSGALSSVAAAQTTFYKYSQDLSGLALATGSGIDRTLYLGFQLSDGTQSGNASTQAFVSNLKLTGGTFGASLGDIGDVRKPDTDSLILRDSAGTIGGLADATRAVTIPVGATAPKLEFIFAFDAGRFDDPTDYFTVSFLTSDLNAVNTTGRVGSEMVGYAVEANATPQIYGVDPTYATGRTAAGDPRFAALARPTISLTPVPEPATLAVLGVGAAAMLRRRKRA